MPFVQAMRTSACSEWGTPQDFFDRLHEEFKFTLDVCATPENTKCTQFYSPDDDSLQQTWNGVCWMNPPYGRQISKWIQKAYESSLSGASVVCLVPARTDTRWWHNYCSRGEIRFVRGRLQFCRPDKIKDNAPFPCAVVIFRKRMRRVILESPYAGDVATNINYARLAVRDSVLRGESPIASHLLYTQPTVLDDTVPEERQLGIEAGLAWRSVAEATVVYADLGISQGMRYGIQKATQSGIPVEVRHIKR